MVKKRKSSWDGLGDELFTRLCNGLKSLTFIAYFLIGILAIGGVGIWLPYWMNDSENKVLLESQNVLTFYLAILGTLSIDGYILKKKNTSLAAIGLMLGVLSLGVGVYGYIILPVGMSILVNVAALITLIIFLFSAVNDEKFDSEHDDSDSLADATGFKETSVTLIKDKS
ncbi:TPA: hypothetical protein NBT51_002727 [Vibrio parahaemolyticus]|nr:hypothetical protein [Vibrio parahaemolyticus]